MACLTLVSDIRKNQWNHNDCFTDDRKNQWNHNDCLRPWSWVWCWFLTWERINEITMIVSLMTERINEITMIVSLMTERINEITMIVYGHDHGSDAGFWHEKESMEWGWLFHRLARLVHHGFFASCKHRLTFRRRLWEPISTTRQRLTTQQADISKE